MPPRLERIDVPDWKSVHHQSLRGGGIMKITTVGLDLAKTVFTLEGADVHGKTVLRKTVRRAILLELFAQLPACVVAWRHVRERNIGPRELRSLDTIHGSWRRNLSSPYRRLVARTMRMTRRRSVRQ
jgi:hypothetical protein